MNSTIDTQDTICNPVATSLREFYVDCVNASEDEYAVRSLFNDLLEISNVSQLKTKIARFADNIPHAELYIELSAKYDGKETLRAVDGRKKLKGDLMEFFTMVYFNQGLGVFRGKGLMGVRMAEDEWQMGWDFEGKNSSNNPVFIQVKYASGEDFGEDGALETFFMQCATSSGYVAEANQISMILITTADRVMSRYQDKEYESEGVFEIVNYTKLKKQLDGQPQFWDQLRLDLKRNWEAAEVMHEVLIP